MAHAQNAVAGDVCVETHKDEQMHPWVMEKVVEPVFGTTRAAPHHVLERDVIQFEPLGANKSALTIQH